jgi:UDP-glucuronate decarboxylase
MQRKPDIGQARALLSWEPTIALEDGLEKTIAYFRELLGEQATAVQSNAAE